MQRQNSSLKVLMFLLFGAVTIGGLAVVNSVLQQQLAPEDTSASVSNSFVLSQLTPQEGTRIEAGDVIEVAVATELPDTDTGSNPAVAELVIVFDSGALAANEVRVGEGVLALNRRIDNTAGTIFIDVSHAGTGGFTGKTTLVTVEFEAKEITSPGTQVAIDAVRSTYGFPNVLDPAGGTMSLPVKFTPDPVGAARVRLFIGTQEDFAVVPKDFQVSWELRGVELSECRLTGIPGNLFNFADNPNAQSVDIVNVAPGNYQLVLTCGVFSDSIDVTVVPDQEPETPTPTPPPATPGGSPVCGNGICEVGEVSTCSQDCPLPTDPGTDPGVMCTMDVRQCEDGSFVGRDPENGCAFHACPTGEELPSTPVPVSCGNGICELGEKLSCVQDCSLQPGVDIDPTLICTSFVYGPWSECKNNIQTRAILSQSPEGCRGGGPVVKRTCGINASPLPGGGIILPLACPVDTMTCPDGTVVKRDPTRNCEFVCPGSSACTPVPSCAYGEMIDGTLQFCELSTNVNWCPYECTPLPPCAYGGVGTDACILGGSSNWCAKVTPENTPALPVVCKADFDNSGTIDLPDLAIFALNYKKEDMDCSLDIVGNDCKLDIADFQVFGQNYKQSNICLNVSTE